MTRIELPGYPLVGIRAANPGPFSLSGTNTWIIGRDPAWVVDPGPLLDDHVEAVVAEIELRSGLGGIALTHDHVDHSEAVPAIRARFPAARFGGARGEVDVRLSDGSAFGPLEAVATPGHAPDHLAYVTSDVAMTGDAVLGEGSVFVAPDPGALAGYLDGLSRLRERELSLICPGHGPPVHDPAAKLDEYISHRLERERRLVARWRTASGPSTSCSTTSGRTHRRASSGRGGDARCAPGQARRRGPVARRRGASRAPGVADRRESLTPAAAGAAALEAADSRALASSIAAASGVAPSESAWSKISSQRVGDSADPSAGARRRHSRCR